jgi:sugar lactone lactonase YvrE
LAGGITIDDQGRVWFGSADSSLWQLDPLSEERVTSLGYSSSESIFTQTLFVDGFYTSDMSISTSGVIYTPNTNTSDLWRIPPTGNYDDFSNYTPNPLAKGDVSIVVNEEGLALLGLPHGKILEFNQNGNRSPYASLFTRSMTLGADSLIYAVGGDIGKFKEIVQIDNLGNVKTLAIDVAGTSLGNEDVYITIAQREGFYVFRRENSSLYYLDYDDNSNFIVDLSALTGGGPVVMTASPVTGDIFLGLKGTSVIFRIDPSGNSEIFASGFIGGVSAMAVSPDGKTLFIAEGGAIGRISLPAP